MAGKFRQETIFPLFRVCCAREVNFFRYNIPQTESGSGSRLKLNWFRKGLTIDLVVVSGIVVLYGAEHFRNSDVCN